MENIPSIPNMPNMSGNQDEMIDNLFTLFNEHLLLLDIKDKLREKICVITNYDQILVETFKTLESLLGKILYIVFYMHEDKGHIAIKNKGSLSVETVFDIKRRIIEEAKKYAEIDISPDGMFFEDLTPPDEVSGKNITPDWQSFTMVPLHVNAEFVGLIGAVCLEGEKHDLFAKDQYKVKFISTDVAVAIYNANVYAHEMYQKEEIAFRLDTINKMGNLMSHEVTLDQMLSSLLNISLGIFGAEVSSVMLWEEGQLKPKLELGLNEELVGSIKFTDGKRVIDEVLEVGKLMNFKDIRQDDRIRVKDIDTFVNSFLCIPLKAYDKTIGLLNIVNQSEEVFSDDLYALFNTISGLAGIAIENAQLYEKLKQRIELVSDELAQTNQNLLDEKNLLEIMINSMVEGVIATDTENKVILINSCAHNILKIPEKEDYSLTDIPNKEIQDAVSSVTKEKAGEVISKQVILPSEDGDTIVSFIVVRVTDDSGVFKGTVSVLRDVTKEKQIDDMKSEFVSSVSHELRTPLVAVKQTIALLLSGNTGEINENQQRFLSIALNNVERLNRLIEDLLDISQIEAGKFDLKPTWIDIEEVMKECVASFDTFFTHKNVLFELKRPDEKMSKIFADRDRIIQVGTNLLGNALKFAPDGSTITVGMENVVDKEGKQVTEVYVHDEGIGVAKKDIDKIFDKFYKSGSPDSVTVKGTGLGLPIAKKIIDMHGGHIWVESGEGKGSKFIFTLPYKVMRKN